MGVFLLDANVLIALAWPEHQAHERVGRWFSRNSNAGWATCPFTQSAFVRILSNPAFSPNALTPQRALQALDLNLLLPEHHFWAANISIPESIKSVERQVTGHRQITDAYLIGLTIRHRGKLATLDHGMKALDAKDVVELIR